MNYKSINDLHTELLNKISIIPHDIDLVVGVPRSGLFVANLIALLLNKPLTDVDGLLENRIFHSGRTKDTENCITSIYECKKILVVEDSVNSGKSLNNCKAQIASANLQCEIIFFAAYVLPGKENDVDCYLQTIGSPRAFEWNIFHHNIMENTCMDIDGVLCDDPTAAENDDGVNYRFFLLNTKPKIIPSKRVKYLVTSRLEKYREETEQWLNDNAIKYDKLIMLDATAEERRAQGLHAKFKAGFYERSDCRLFVESSKIQAEYINASTGKPVYCVENNYLYDGNRSYKLQNETARNVKRSVKKFVRKSTFLRKIYDKLRNNNRNESLK